METMGAEPSSVAGRLSRDVENDIAEAWRAIDAGSQQPIPARYRIPHLSFQLLEDPPSEKTLDQLEQLAIRWTPVPVRLGGLGVFRQPRAVLYITVVRSPRLEALQRDVTLKLVEAGHKPHRLYRPDSWVPHVSIAFGSPGIKGWKRVLQQEKQGVFHRRTYIESLLVLSADRRRPLAMEAPLGMRAGGQRTEP